MSDNLRVNIWERQIYERLLKSEPSIVKLIKNKSDLSKLSTFSGSSIIKFIENQSEHLSKLTSCHLKNRGTRRSRRAREPSRIWLLFLRDLNRRIACSEEIRLQKDFNDWDKNSSKLHRYVNKVRKLYHAQYKCNNKRHSKIINLNKIIMAILKKAYLSCFVPRKQTLGDLKAHLAIEMSLNNS